MPDLNPLKPGDVPFPQYSVTTTQTTTAIQYTKGIIYTKDAAGRLIVVAATLAPGIFQAAVTPTLVSVVDDEIQVLGPRTRMILQVEDSITLHEGEDVLVVANTNKVTSGAKSSDLYLGKVFEVYSKDQFGTKQISIVGSDANPVFVIVETVGP